MKLTSNKFNFNSTLISIVRGNPDGVVRECLIDYTNQNKDQQLINYAFDLKEAINTEVYLSVKFPYGSRPKRLEIVFKTNELIVLCKFTNSKRVDEAALELQTIITSAENNSNDKFYKGLVIYPHNNQKAITDKFAAKQLPGIRFVDTKNLNLGKFCGIFN